MRVGLNLFHLVPGETGGSELYARRLIGALAESDAQLTAFASQLAIPSLEEEGWGDNVKLLGLRFDPRSRVRRVLAEQTLLVHAARKNAVDLLHNVFTTAPAIPGVPQVTTILDVIYKRYPETHARLLGQGLAGLTWIAARRSDRVIAISEAAKTDIVRFLGVETDRVDVTYLGPALHADRLVDEATIRRDLDLGDRPIVLTVSAKRPHKNLERLFEAFVQVRAKSAPILIVPGYPTFHEDALRALVRKLGADQRIRFTGWLDDEILDGLYRAATCFVFPSLAEGFGLPILDALARGTPTACSNATSLPEVAGDAALYFDPTDTAGIAAAIERLLQDSALRARLRAKGPEQAQKFSWAATAEATLQSYDRTLAGR